MTLVLWYFGLWISSHKDILKNNTLHHEGLVCIFVLVTHHYTMRGLAIKAYAPDMILVETREYKDKRKEEQNKLKDKSFSWLCPIV